MSNVLSRILCVLLLALAAFSQSAPSPSKIAQLKQKAQAGDAQAQTELGLAYRDKNPDAAAEWFRKAADQGNPVAQNSLGVLYHDGRGVPKDFEQAFSWYRKAAAQKYGAGMFNVAISYYNGEGVPEEMVTAYAWMLLADEAGEKEAHDAVERTAQELGNRANEGELLAGQILDAGKELPRDEAGAAKWYRVAADGGNGEAQVRYGLMLADGRGGTTKDLDKAAQLIERAAERGSVPAMFSLGYAYQKGTLGRPVNYGDAVSWYQKAAAAGHPGAMVNLGLMNTDGTAGTINYEKAYFWLYMANAFNIPQAQSSLPMVASHLSDKQIKTAQESVAAWWQKNGRALLVRHRPNEVAAPELVQKDKIGASDQVDSIGGEVHAPRLLSGPEPKMDPAHRASGMVILRFVVGADGRTRDIEVVKSLSKELDQEAIAALKQWTFSPATKNGEPVAVKVTTEFNFEVR